MSFLLSPHHCNARGELWRRKQAIEGTSEQLTQQVGEVGFLFSPCRGFSLILFKTFPNVPAAVFVPILLSRATLLDTVESALAAGRVAHLRMGIQTMMSTGLARRHPSALPVRPQGVPQHISCSWGTRQQNSRGPATQHTSCRWGIRQQNSGGPASQHTSCSLPHPIWNPVSEMVFRVCAKS